MKESFNFSGQENVKGLYSRVAEDAIRILKAMEGLKPEIKERTVFLIKNPEFEAKVKAGWDNDTFRGVVDPDPEAQEGKWAKGLIQRAISEVSTKN